MTISRRMFLGSVTGTITMLRAVWGHRIGGSKSCLAPLGSQGLGCVLLDSGRDCVLPESLAGYEAFLINTGILYSKTATGPLPLCRTLIVPGCVTVCPEVARGVCALLKRGSSVVLESAAGFADPLTFVAHQEFLRAHFDLRVGLPVNLWEGEGFSLPSAHSAVDGRRPGPYQKHDARRVPYVDFAWPVPAKIRDFSCVVPLSGPSPEAIGWVDGIPVAGKRKAGKGSLVFLGSPLGPLLLSGDPEAYGWLRELLSLA